MDKIRISGVGCCLMDRIFGHVDFTSGSFPLYMSLFPGDGGLVPGKLTFEEDLERYSRQSFVNDILPLLTLGAAPDKENVGGPCIVALINASQIAWQESTCSFYGCRGDDETGRRLMVKLSATGVNLDHYRQVADSETPSTSVLSDPVFDMGHGERTFVNTIGAAWQYGPDDIDESFYEADICVFGATALVPRIHQNLTQMLRKAKFLGRVTVVNTVYDFISEKNDATAPWMMGESDESYSLIDLLIVDYEEALRLSGESDAPSALAFFREKGVGAVVITNGAKDVTIWADSPLFGTLERTMPVSQAVGRALREGREGDSTGCGDNFAGGIIASLARQMYQQRREIEEEDFLPVSDEEAQALAQAIAEAAAKAKAQAAAHPGSPGPISPMSPIEPIPSIPVFDLTEACRWGIVSGGFATFYYGGTYLEQHPGEKLAQLQELYDQYRQQEAVC